jgi:rare lipoprotein A (peptidoglycan hydrolase)
VLLVPAFYIRTALVHPPAPAFDLSAAESPSALDGPHATWLSPDRIVVEPEVVPYRPTPSTTAVLTASGPLRADPEEKDDTEDAPRARASPTTTDPPAPAPVTKDGATATSTTTVPPPATTTTTTTVAVTLPTILAPVGPLTTGTATETNRGWASWFGAPEGTCAHRTLPMGTEITVTRVSTGVTTTCVVDDWGPADTTRVIDLSTDTFAQLASPEAGLVEVIIDW